MPLTRPRLTQFDTAISSISDPVTVLNKSSTLANIDVGFIINRNGGTLANTAIFWNESANTFALAFTTSTGESPNANISISTYANLRINTLNSTFVNTTGNVLAAGSTFNLLRVNHQLGGSNSSSFNDSVTTATSSNQTLKVNGGNQYVFFNANLGAGNYNSLTSGNDIGIIFSGFAGQGSGNLVIAPWNVSQAGIRIVGTTGLVQIPGQLTINANNSPTAIALGGTAGVGNIGVAGTPFNTAFLTTVNATGNILATTGVFNNVIVNTGNVNAVGGYFIGSGQFLTGLPTAYSNVNVKAYTESMGFQNYGNVNVAAYVTTNGLTNYSNVNVIAYTQTQSYTNYSNVNLTAYLGGAVSVGGNLTVAGNLIVQGTTTTLNSTTLDVTDLNITVAKGAATAAAANGAGLTVDGAGATLLYTSSTDSWNINKTFISNSFVNTSGNISTAQLNAGQINTSGNVLAVDFVGSGALLTALPGYAYSNVNVKAYTESMGFQNYGNVNVIAYLAGGVTSTGFINTSGNVSGAVVNAGALNVTGTTTLAAVNSTGFINTSGNVSAAVGLFGSVNSTGLINTSGNVSAAQINSATAVVTGSTNVGELFVRSVGDDEGGQINLGPAVTNTTLVGNVTIDVYQNRLRIWEGGGTNRGGYFDIAGLSAGVGTNLAAGGGGGTPGGTQGQIQFNSSSTFQGAVSLYYFAANGAIVANAGIASTSTTTGTMQITGGIGVTGNVTADIFNSVNNGSGTNFKVGDDVWLGDINIANTLGIRGQQDGTQGYIRFGNVNTNALGVSGSGSLSWGGNLAIGSLAVPGALHTIIGNVDVTGAGTEYFNIGGNIMAIQGSFGSINSTGYINTTANIAAASINAGTSTIGSITLSAGVIFRNGSETQIVGGGSQTTRAILRLGNGQGAVLYGSGSASAPTVPATGIIIHGGDGNVRIQAPNIASGGSRIQIQAQLVEIQGNLTPLGNLVYNIGNVTNQWNTIYGKSTQAQYADLAEIYTTDQQYPAGTVVVFGGEAEVTQSRASHDTRIAGVVSTNPAYLMNSTETGVPVALQGRVPCRVLGPVSQGDRVVSSHISGVAQALDPLQYQPGCIIGKALQAIDSTDISTIEVVVGRV